MQLKLCPASAVLSHLNWINQPGSSYLSQPGISLKTSVFSLPYWLTRLTDVDCNLKQHIQCFCRIDQKTMILYFLICKLENWPSVLDKIIWGI